MGVRTRVGLGIAAALVAMPVVVASGAQQPAAKVNAEGDIFTPGSLKFDPASVSVKVGQVVRWTNTNDKVPHTATEDHGLWDLSGDYGIPGNTGFGPGESRQRVFEAGTQHYYCKVHPDQMHGVVAVPVKLAVTTLADGGRRINIRWAAHHAAAGQVYGVQVKKNDGPWLAFRSKVTGAATSIVRHGPKAVLRFRARLRRADDASLATGWSPPAKVTG